jgi:hypothetical protein
MKRHSLDPFSLVFGTAFASLGLIFVITRAKIANLHLAWVWPIPLIVLGVLIIGMAARGERDRDREEAADG